MVLSNVYAGFKLAIVPLDFTNSVALGRKSREGSATVVELEHKARSIDLRVTSSTSTIVPAPRGLNPRCISCSAPERQVRPTFVSRCAATFLSASSARTKSTRGYHAHGCGRPHHRPNHPAAACHLGRHCKRIRIGLGGASLRGNLAAGYCSTAVADHFRKTLAVNTIQEELMPFAATFLARDTASCGEVVEGAKG